MKRLSSQQQVIDHLWADLTEFIPQAHMHPSRWICQANRIVQRSVGHGAVDPFRNIHGTLTRTQNGYIPFNRAILDTFGVAGDIRSVFPDGKTDPRILEKIFVKAEAEINVSDEQLGRFSMSLARSLYRSVARWDDYRRRSRRRAGVIGAIVRPRRGRPGRGDGQFRGDGAHKASGRGIGLSTKFRRLRERFKPPS